MSTYDSIDEIINAHSFFISNESKLGCECSACEAESKQGYTPLNCKYCGFVGKAERYKCICTKKKYDVDDPNSYKPCGIRLKSGKKRAKKELLCMHGYYGYSTNRETYENQILCHICLNGDQKKMYEIMKAIRDLLD